MRNVLARMNDNPWTCEFCGATYNCRLPHGIIAASYDGPSTEHYSAPMCVDCVAAGPETLRQRMREHAHIQMLKADGLLLLANGAETLALVETLDA
jgi:hypothetical protein